MSHNTPSFKGNEDIQKHNELGTRGAFATLVEEGTDD